MTTTVGDTNLDATIAHLQTKLNPESLAQIAGVYAFHFKDLG